MLFNSYPFVFAFLPLVLVLFFLLGRSSHRGAALWLALASLFFYGWWSPKFVLLLLASIAFNFAAGRLIAREPGSGSSRAWLGVAVVANLAVLAVFKYANLLVVTMNAAGAALPVLNLLLPVGISFFTFTQIAYLVDTHRGLVKEFDPLHYLLFVTWFPHLVSGPVLHHRQMMPQFALHATYRPSADSVSVGLAMFCLGLFKKVVLADQLAPYVAPVFDGAAQGGAPTAAAAWSAALAYALQLYFDFSGYSDMAIGLSRLFNVKLPLNFDSPYKAGNIIDFWRRWHMTLSAFLRDYLYLPLGGNRKGPARRHLNLMITMLLGGLWHGAGWNFALWGGLHGLFLMVNHGWRALVGGRAAAPGRLIVALTTGLTFVAVVWAWVPFRAASMAATLALWKGMLGLNGHGLQADWVGRVAGPGVEAFEVIGWLAAGLFIVWALPNTQQWLSHHDPAWESVAPRRGVLVWQPTRRLGLLMGLVFAWCVLSFTRNSPFLYYQF